MKRHELRKLANKKHQDPLNTIIREQYHDTLAQYKKLINSKKNDYLNAKISELEKLQTIQTRKLTANASNRWATLEKEIEDVPSISEENWLQYFHNLHSNEHLNPRSKTFAMNYDKMNAMFNTVVL